MGKQYPKYAPGDQVRDLTFDPPIAGVVTNYHDKPDSYFVRLERGANDVVIHARNLERNT